MWKEADMKHLITA